MSHPTENHSCCCHNTTPEKKPEPAISQVKKTSHSLPSILMSIMIAFFPKCPMCWAVYMSMFGSLGLAKLPYLPWLLPVLLTFLAIHLYMLFRKASEKSYLPFVLSLIGALLLVLCRAFFPSEKWLLYIGMASIISGSLLNSFSNNINLSNLQFKKRSKNPTLWQFKN